MHAHTHNTQEAILPGIFNLLKLCAPNDIAFIKASVDAATRDSFQTLVPTVSQIWGKGVAQSLSETLRRIA